MEEAVTAEERFRVVEDLIVAEAILTAQHYFRLYKISPNNTVPQPEFASSGVGRVLMTNREAYNMGKKLFEEEYRTEIGVQWKLLISEANVGYDEWLRGLK